MNRERVAGEREGVLYEEANKATAIRENMARLRELRLAKEAQAVRTEISAGNQYKRVRPRRRFKWEGSASGWAAASTGQVLGEDKE
jgi:hypothetical protein